MIRVEVWRTPDGALSRFRIQGHAGYDEHGRDIVCAGVTAVAETAILGLERVAGQPCRVQRSQGYLECRLEPAAAADPTARVVLETMLLGLKDIEKDYGSFIRLIEGG